MFTPAGLYVERSHVPVCWVSPSLFLASHPINIPFHCQNCRSLDDKLYGPPSFEDLVKLDSVETENSLGKDNTMNKKHGHREDFGVVKENMFSLTVALATRKGIIGDKSWEGELRSDFEYPECQTTSLGFYVVGNRSP